jgi:hypothetical protein
VEPAVSASLRTGRRPERGRVRIMSVFQRILGGFS